MQRRGQHALQGAGLPGSAAGPPSAAAAELTEAPTASPAARQVGASSPHAKQLMDDLTKISQHTERK
jgi:hypothetical protein